jgi:AcrR family transcriptional regulator
MAADTAPGGSRREEKKARLRVALTRAAVDLCQEHGFDGTTVEQIAARAGTSPSTFFRYFGTKEDVLFGDANERFAVLRERFAQSTGAEDPVEVVEAALVEQIGDYANFDDDRLEAECAALWTAEPALRRRYVEIVLEWEEAIAEYLAVAWGVAPSSLRPRITAMALIAVVRVALESGEDGREHAKRVAQDGFRLLGEGVGAARRADG